MTPANHTPPLRLFLVSIKCGKEVVQRFEVYGASSMDVGVQHQGLCNTERGEYVNVKPLTQGAAL